MLEKRFLAKKWKLGQCNNDFTVVAYYCNKYTTALYGILHSLVSVTYFVTNVTYFVTNVTYFVTNITYFVTNVTYFVTNVTYFVKNVTYFVKNVTYNCKLFISYDLEAIVWSIYGRN